MIIDNYLWLLWLLVIIKWLFVIILLWHVSVVCINTVAVFLFIYDYLWLLIIITMIIDNYLWLFVIICDLCK